MRYLVSKLDTCVGCPHSKELNFSVYSSHIMCELTTDTVYRGNAHEYKGDIPESCPLPKSVEEIAAQLL